MPEEAFQNKILAYCTYLRLKVFHAYDSRKSTGPGFPDLVIVGKNGVLFAELKSTKGRVSFNQSEWMNALDAAGAEVHLWRPENWPEVQTVLKRIAGA